MNARELAAKWDTMEEWKRAEYTLRKVLNTMQFNITREAGLEALDILVAKIEGGLDD